MPHSSLDPRSRRLPAWTVILAALFLLLLMSLSLARLSRAQSESRGASNERERLSPGLAVDFPVDI